MTGALATDQLAAALRDITANLQAYIEQRAEEIAAPRIKAAADDAAELVAEAVGAHVRDQQRWDDLKQEFHRQIDNLESQRAKLAWIARFLPSGIRSWSFGGTRNLHPFPRPADTFADGVDRAAAELGLTPYAEDDQ